MQNIITSIAPFLTNKKYILIGENHGVIENAQFIESLVSNIQETKKISYVGFEYPTFCLPDYKEAISNNRYTLLENLPVTEMLLNDGRFSLAHFELLKYLYSHHIQFNFFDSGIGNWDDRDRAMYENIVSIQSDIEGVSIIVAGNIHTSLHSMNIDGKDYTPLGSHFDTSEVLLITLSYHGGEYFNFGRKPFPNTSVPANQLIQIDNNHFTFHIPVATPTK